MRKKHVWAVALLAVLITGTVAVVGWTAQRENAQGRRTVIIYNSPPEWADWASQHRAIKSELGITVPPDNKNSGQAIAALTAERASPVADAVYLGGIAVGAAMNAGVLTPYRPRNWERIPDNLKCPNGYWFTIHSGTLGLFVNTAALGGRPIPQRWTDLLKPEYRGMVGYLDPTSAAVGQLGVMAVNLALGGTYENLDPAIDFFRRLADNQPIVPTKTAYARVISGEIPIMLDFDFNAYRGQHTDRAPVRFVIPQEGTLSFPYVMGMVRNGPNPAQARRVLDFVLSGHSQRLWGNAFLRPVFPEYMSAETRAKFLPESEYARVQPVDLQRLIAAQATIIARYRNDVRGMR